MPPPPTHAAQLAIPPGLTPAPTSMPPLTWPYGAPTERKGQDAPLTLSWRFMPLIMCVSGLLDDGGMVQFLAGETKWQSWLTAYSADFTGRANELESLHLTSGCYLPARVQEQLLYTPFAGGGSRVPPAILDREAADVGRSAPFAHALTPSLATPPASARRPAQGTTQKATQPQGQGSAHTSAQIPPQETRPAPPGPPFPRQTHGPLGSGAPLSKAATAISGAELVFLFLARMYFFCSHYLWRNLAELQFSPTTESQKIFKFVFDLTEMPQRLSGLPVKMVNTLSF